MLAFLPPTRGGDILYKLHFLFKLGSCQYVQFYDEFWNCGHLFS